MALKIPSPFPISAPPLLNPTQTHHRHPSELRFARWNNANAEKFNERRRAQKEIEDDIRRERRFDSATRIARYYDSATPSDSDSSFKSTGTPSFPSRPSIPGKKSKYSKNPHYPNPNFTSDPLHPAFRQFRRTKVSNIAVNESPSPINRNIRIADDGVSYVIDGAPFEFKYSYTETPKAKPLELREAPYSPFGPGTMPRPWTGRAPLPSSKKKLREFDSFRLPPPHKKGVKPVQAPGPYLPGSGPKYVKSREEILGEPLTKEEIMTLVEACQKTKRQMNMGRDGLTHNMLDNIHAHWKRRRVCKIKCKGVCTVDMENVRQQLEERTGGKIIYKTGGVIYLFRGRNYNYRSRPRFPLMLWRPITPVYPRLVQRVPEGMTLEEVTEMRKKGHKLIPICKLGKNGVYSNLVDNVREAFEECELARIDCQGMNGSDYRKIGGKLRDLVPCELLSFAYEHILMWRGRDWKSSLPKLDTVPHEANESSVENATSVAPPSQREEATTSIIAANDESLELFSSSSSNDGLVETAGEERSEDLSPSEDVEPLPSTSEVPNSAVEPETVTDIQTPPDDTTVLDNSVHAVTTVEVGPDDDMGSVDEPPTLPLLESAETTPDIVEEDLIGNEDQQVTSEPNEQCTQGVLALLLQALESGGATILDDADLDADIVYRKMVTFSRSAPPDPVFRHRLRKVRVKTSEVQEDDELAILDLEPQAITTSPDMARRGERKSSKSNTYRRKDFGEHLLDNVVPQGSLRVDELAKLLG